MPRAEIASGTMTKRAAEMATPKTKLYEAMDWNPASIAAALPPTYDSLRSWPMPAISLALSPTLSAIVAGLRGSSSSNSNSPFPTVSAAESADLVKIPPATRAMKAMKLAPNEKVMTVLVIMPINPFDGISGFSTEIRKYQKDKSSKPNPQTEKPMTAPPFKAARKLGLNPFLV